MDSLTVKEPLLVLIARVLFSLVLVVSFIMSSVFGRHDAAMAFVMLILAWISTAIFMSGWRAFKELVSRIKNR